jgi:two-component system chemotaxis response regulator CheB
MGSHDIMVLGASAGGIEALTRVMASLPENLPASLFVVVHIPAHMPSLLPKIFSRSAPLPAVHPVDGEPIVPGRIYVAPPDRHLLVRPGVIRVVAGPKENGHRPAVDPLFRSAAEAYGSRVVGVILSGSLDDGTAGLRAVKARGGVAIVQSPEEALYASMPRNAIEHVEVDHVMPAHAIGQLLTELAGHPGPEKGGTTEDEALGRDVRFEELDPDVLHTDPAMAAPSGFACPDCGGVLWELNGEQPFRFRCRVGHSWTAAALLGEQADVLDSALWMALRALEERASLSERLARRMNETGSPSSAGRFAIQAAGCRRSAEVIRRLIVSGRLSAAGEPAGQTPVGATAADQSQDTSLSTQRPADPGAELSA